MSYQTVAIAAAVPASWNTDYVLLSPSQFNVSGSSVSLLLGGAGSSGTSLTPVASQLSFTVGSSNVTAGLAAIGAAGSGCTISFDAFGRVTAAAASITTVAVTGVWTSGVSSPNVQGLGSTWTVSRLSSALSIVGNEIWASGFSGFGSIATLSRISSNVSILANEIWSSGCSALGSIATLSRVSSNVSVLAVGVWTSGLSVGNATAGGSLIPAISSTSSKVAAFVVQGSSSSFTRIVWAAAQPGDCIVTTIMPDAAVSSLSSGLIPHSHCTQAGQIEFRLSNCSTLVQNQSSKTWFFVRITPF